MVCSRLCHRKFSGLGVDACAAHLDVVLVADLPYHTITCHIHSLLELAHSCEIELRCLSNGDFKTRIVELDITHKNGFLHGEGLGYLQVLHLCGHRCTRINVRSEHTVRRYLAIGRTPFGCNLFPIATAGVSHDIDFGRFTLGQHIFLRGHLHTEKVVIGH